MFCAVKSKESLLKDYKGTVPIHPYIRRPLCFIFGFETKERIRCRKKLGQSFILRKQPRQTLSYTKQREKNVKSTWIFMAPNVAVWVKESHNTTGRGNKSITPQY